MKYCIFKENKYTGVAYDELTSDIQKFEDNAGRQIIPYEVLPLFKEDKDSKVIEAYELTALEQLDYAKKQKIAEATAYANTLNTFSIVGVDMWMDRSERSAAYMDFNMAADGEDVTISKMMKGENKSFTMPKANGLAALSKVNGYATKTNNQLNVHEDAIGKLTTEALVDSYDFTTKYPDKVVLG